MTSLEYEGLNEAIYTSQLQLIVSCGFSVLCDCSHVVHYCCSQDHFTQNTVIIKTGNGHFEDSGLVVSITYKTGPTEQQVT